jgi:hypothetical protein
MAMLSFHLFVLAFAPATFSVSPVPAAQPPVGSTTRPAAGPTSLPASTNVADPPAHFVPRAWGVRRETDPPAYVRPLSRLGLHGTTGVDWLLLGAEQRTRWEHRDDDYRRGRLTRDDPILMRSRGYVGVQKILDPLRFGFEFQDARQFNGRFPELVSEVDEADILQGFGEFYLADALGKGQPLRFQAGRLSLDLVDRRLVNRSRWTNTGTAFDGFRVQAGRPESDWEVNLLAARPVERRARQPDRPDEEQWLYGLAGTWRRWSTIVSVEPYWFCLDTDRKARDASDREIHTLGLRGYGPIGTTGFDYDLDAAFQFGRDDGNEQRAFASAGEIGYTLEHPWRPRISASSAYASGNAWTIQPGEADPPDHPRGRFDRLFGNNHGWSTLDYLTWQNMVLARIRLEAAPLASLRFDSSYGGYWLASDSDAWVAADRRDPTGGSGRFIGQDIDARLRWQVDPRLELEVGYAHFLPGPFADNTGDADDSDFFYVQTTFQLME